MNARKIVRDAINRKKLLHWKTVALNPSHYGDIPASRAKKNYWRLCSRYPEIMMQLRLNEGSVV
jgi:hypothetical protein